MAVKVKERNGAWWIFIHHHGKRKAKRIGDKRTAQKVAEQVRAKLALGDVGILDERARRPFDMYFRSWLDSYAKTHCKKSTCAVYETVFRLYLETAFGNKDISEITREDVKRVAYGMLNEGKSRAYVKGALAPLSEMFNHAIEDGHVQVNPALRVSSPKSPGRGTTAREGELPVPRGGGPAPRHVPEAPSRFLPLRPLLARTGMRVGEAVGLQWGDIDFNGRFAEVRRGINDGRVSTPKSGKSRRVDLSAQLTDGLKAHLVAQKRETLRRGRMELPTWVFTNEVGNPLDPDNFRSRVWPKLLAKAGLRKVRIHDLRHTYASLLIAQGESLASTPRFPSRPGLRRCFAVPVL